MSQSLFPHPPFCELDSPPQPSTKSLLDVSCSFLLLHWGDVGQPLLRAAGQALSPGCQHTYTPKNLGLAKPTHPPASAVSCLPVPPCTREHCWHLLLASRLAGCVQRSGTFQHQLCLLSHKIPLENAASMDPGESTASFTQYSQKESTGIMTAKLQHPLSV